MDEPFATASGMANPEFWHSIWHSATFWNQCVPFGLAALVLNIAGIAIALGRPKWRTLLRADDGAANAVEFTLVAPLFLVIFSLAAQMAILARAALIVHFAAFSVARSGVVHFCSYSEAAGDALDQMFNGEFSLGESGQALRFKTCTDDESRYQNAARLVLLTISPIDYERYGTCQQQCEIPDDALRAIVANATNAKLAEAAVRKARYAFDPDSAYVSMELSTFNILRNIVDPGNHPAPQATVEFRLPLLLPFANALMQNHPELAIYRGDSGNMFRWIKAEVQLQ